MLADTRRLEEGNVIETGVCVIGAGAAGITLALELEKQGIDAVVLESGGFRPDEPTRDLYRGENVGLPYEFSDGCRSRFLGGSSNCWGGWCRPLDEADFLKREWIPYSGWPFGKSELAPYYERTHDVLKLGPLNYDAAYWESAIGRRDVRRVPLTTGAVVDKVSQFSPPMRFGKYYRSELKRAAKVRVLLYANATEIETNKSASAVTRVRVRTLSGRSVWVSARLFVLAAGGIENARLLLASNSTQAAGLGNGNDVVGRYYMDHPRLLHGKITFKDQWRGNRLYDIKHHYQNRAIAAHGTKIACQFALTEETQREEQISNSRIWLCSIFSDKDTQVAQALIKIKRGLTGETQDNFSWPREMGTLVGNPGETTRFLAERFLRPRFLMTNVKFQAIVEPVPDPDSRVTLAAERDALGMNRVRVNWRMGEIEKRTFDRGFQYVAEELQRNGVADVTMEAPVTGRDWSTLLGELPYPSGTWHHMGSTRMHDSPKLGVVDRNCQVHGVGNLYIAGSSVFPTCGANFPTITLVALALRLSDRITQILRDGDQLSIARQVA